MEEQLTSFFWDASKKAVTAVKTVELTDWMKWATNTSTTERRVVLPMIQRGSVWAPHKLLDLWDTLLRGMPLGALMASEAVGTSVKVLGEAGTRSASVGDIGLIDGQQRTLAMLAGWPQGLQNPLRPVAIWVDLVDDPQGEYRFRLWATTKAQPFGYARTNMGGQALGKLERNKLRLANEAFVPSKQKIDPQALWKQADFMPWESHFALPLAALIAHKGTLNEFVGDRLVEYKNALESKSISLTENKVDMALAQHFAKKLSALPNAAELEKRVPSFERALEKLFACEFPVIHVRQESFTDDDQTSDSNTDPALAILFKRVGTGGEPLSNADYVYSVIKHRAPKVHGMVESLLEDERIRAIYTPTTLVMSAVRLTALSLKTDGGQVQKLTDSAKLDKATFARMVRSHSNFLAEFEKNIQPDGVFVTTLQQVLKGISYSTDGFATGLPKHALCLIHIPLLETILAWHTLCAPTTAAIQESRLPMVRFLLQGNLCVMDYAKASEMAIEALRTRIAASTEKFPDQDLLNQLTQVSKPLAYPMPSPETLETINGLTASPGETNVNETVGLRGWTRFVAEDPHQDSADLYKRWWNRTGRHVHPMLLWLQRDYVFRQFEEEPALAGMDEETPFDFDHILPSAQWANWTGIGGDNRFISFPVKDDKGKVLDDSGHWHIGNSIGNLHVLESSANRSWGDASVHDKLVEPSFSKTALIDDDADWLVAAGDRDKGRHWDAARAMAFQRAVELRAFALYKKFYADLQCGSPNSHALNE